MSLTYRGWDLKEFNDSHTVGCVGYNHSTNPPRETIRAEVMKALFPDEALARRYVVKRVIGEIDFGEDLRDRKPKEGAPETLWEA